MPHRANTGPTNLLYLLKRRRVTFQRWCHEHEITTQTQYLETKLRIESKGEFFLPGEMDTMAQELPKNLPGAPGEPVEEVVQVEVAPESLPALEELLEANEEIPSSRKRKSSKTV